MPTKKVARKNTSWGDIKDKDVVTITLRDDDDTKDVGHITIDMGLYQLRKPYIASSSECTLANSRIMYNSDQNNNKAIDELKLSVSEVIESIEKTEYNIITIDNNIEEIINILVTLDWL